MQSNKVITKKFSVLPKIKMECRREEKSLKTLEWDDITSTIPFHISWWDILPLPQTTPFSGLVNHFHLYSQNSTIISITWFPIFASTNCSHLDQKKGGKWRTIMSYSHGCMSCLLIIKLLSTWSLMVLRIHFIRFRIVTVWILIKKK